MRPPRCFHASEGAYFFHRTAACHRPIEEPDNPMAETPSLDSKEISCVTVMACVSSTAPAVTVLPCSATWPFR
ncbi:Uncharacterised protein [Bordetella pertussis]|nr:Uncharacterised protein [Bordetella pertussis]